MNDRTLGAILLISAIIFYIYFTIWVIGTPFYPAVASLFPPVRYALLTAATIGLLFIGSLSVFTIYTLYPL